MGSKLSKKFLSQYSKAYEKQIKASERIFYYRLRKIYLNAFKSSVEQYFQYLDYSRVNIIDTIQFTKTYVEIYSETGMRFAKWYKRIFEKMLSKQGGEDELLRAIFARYGENQAGKLVVTIEDTLRERFLAVMKEQFADPTFQALGAQEQADVLMKDRFWSKTARWMALRVSRTENNAAANLAIEESSLTLFSKEEMTKQWQTSADDRVRPTHAALEGKQIEFDQYFQVGNVQMKRPNDPDAIGDSKSVASERINCRCRLITVPKESVIEDAFENLRRNYEQNRTVPEGTYDSTLTSIFAMLR